MTLSVETKATSKVATVAVLGTSDFAGACLRRLDTMEGVTVRSIRIEDLKASTDDLIVAVPNVFEGMQWRVRAAHNLSSRHVPLLPVLFLPPSTVTVGPVCHPPHTACLKCLHLRLTANGVTHEGLPELAHDAHGIRLVKRVAEWVAQHLLHPRQASKMEAIDLHHDRVTHHLVLPVPACGVCRAGDLPPRRRRGASSARGTGDRPHHLARETQSAGLAVHRHRERGQAGSVRAGRGAARARARRHGAHRGAAGDSLRPLGGWFPPGYRPGSRGGHWRVPGALRPRLGARGSRDLRDGRGTR